VTRPSASGRYSLSMACARASVGAHSARAVVAFQQGSSPARKTLWPGGGVVGLHGTSEPGLVPGRPSHGCIRLRNPDIERLYALTPIGTPLLVR
jgi:lipoprotein-anchoring transpeptidase ErfK/SrfK